MPTFTFINADRVDFTDNKVEPFAVAGEQTSDRNGHIFYIPTSMKPFIAEGKLAKDLFNLTKLNIAKYDDQTRQTLPILIKHHGNLCQIAGLTIKRQFNIINYSSAEIDKTRAHNVLMHLMAQPYVEHIKLDEVLQLHQSSHF